MKKTYREVVEDIKEGEVWIGKYFKVHMEANGRICMNFYKPLEKCSEIIIKENDMFTLQRQEYDFSEAYKAYKEGKEIESLESGYSRMKLINGTNMFYSKISNKWVDKTVMTFEQIDGKWYIND